MMTQVMFPFGDPYFGAEPATGARREAEIIAARIASARRWRRRRFILRLRAKVFGRRKATGPGLVARGRADEGAAPRVQAA